jgi:hypothetical protein
MASKYCRRFQSGSVIETLFDRETYLFCQIAWLSIGLSSWRFRQAWIRQGRPLDELKFRSSWTWPWGPPFVVSLSQSNYSCLNRLIPGGIRFHPYLKWLYFPHFLKVFLTPWFCSTRMVFHHPNVLSGGFYLLLHRDPNYGGYVLHMAVFKSS